MAKRLFEQCQVTLAGNDISADVNALTLMAGRRSPVDVTGLSDTWDAFLVPNIRKWGVSLDYFNNFAGSSETPVGINYVLNSVLSSTNTTGVSFVLRSTTAIRSVQNPEWSGQVQLDGDFIQTGGGVAEADKGSVALKGLGILTRVTTAT